MLRGWGIGLQLAFAASIAGAWTAAPRASASVTSGSAALERELDGLMERAIRSGLTPGAVLLVERQGRILHYTAYGDAQADTIYDIASLTKVLTAALVMSAVDEGRLGLSDTLAAVLPEAAAGRRASITVEQLLRHGSGLIADNPISDYSGTPAQIWPRIFGSAQPSAPGARFIYSDVGYLFLQAILEKATGQGLDDLALDRLFLPLKMADSGFRPLGSSAKCDRCAPTRAASSRKPGEVHDPRALALGGVAGHAGAFSTAADLARFGRMILGCGELEGARVLSAPAVRSMVEPVAFVSGDVRGLGWDIDTEFSAPRGSAFPVGSFGHTGFTGTSIWIDPSSQTQVILLTNRVMSAVTPPSTRGRSSIQNLRHDVASAVGRSIKTAPLPSKAGLAQFCQGKGKP